MVFESVFWQQTVNEFWLLLEAPLWAPEMLWILAPLIATFLVMTFYFGLYQREELGWNTSVANTIVLFFVAIDLLRTMFYYSSPPSAWNYLLNPWKFLTIILIIAEAILLFALAFRHAIPKHVMFFIASPLPVNLQAYVIAAIVYLRLPPTWYTLFAALLLFAVLFVVSKGLQWLQWFFVEQGHRRAAADIEDLRDRAKLLREKARRARGRKKKKLEKEAEELSDSAKQRAKKLKQVEKEQHGRLRAAKRLD